MTRFITIATAIKNDDRATVHYHAPRVEVGARLHVSLTDEIDVFGPPDAVIGLLTDALAKCHAHMVGREIKEEKVA